MTVDKKSDDGEIKNLFDSDDEKGDKPPHFMMEKDYVEYLKNKEKDPDDDNEDV